jgi:predicted nucleic acid-binding Zn ribbon protein
MPEGDCVICASATKGDNAVIGTEQQNQLKLASNTRRLRRVMLEKQRAGIMG